MIGDAASLRIAPAGVTEPAVLRLEDVCRSWGRRQILRGVDLELMGGSAVAIFGANGVGKTTLVRIAAGLVAPDAGRVRLAGLDPVRDRRAFQRRLGVLTAGDRGLYARLTVAQNVRLWAALSLVDPARETELLTRACARFELGPTWKSRVDRISQGQRQRVRLAMTFLHEPELVLLDEPHTSLDDAGLAQLSAAIEELLARGGAALWCAPSIRGIELPARRRLVLGADGKLVAR